MQDYITLPGGVTLDAAWCRSIVRQIKQQQRKLERARAIELELVHALRLAKDMFIANDCILPHTFEVIDAALDKAVRDLGLQHSSASGAANDDTK